MVRMALEIVQAVFFGHVTWEATELFRDRYGRWYEQKWGQAAPSPHPEGDLDSAVHALLGCDENVDIRVQLGRGVPHLALLAHLPMLAEDDDFETYQQYEATRSRVYWEQREALFLIWDEFEEERQERLFRMHRELESVLFG